MSNEGYRDYLFLMTATQKTPRVRIAPSPTGDPHIGTAYIGLFNYVFAKKHGGKFIIRIEDTDQTRYRKSSEDQILEALNWFGISWDEGPDKGGPFGPYKQSQRLPLYQKEAETLIQKGHAYRCFCSVERLESVRRTQMANKQPPGYDRHCRELPAEEVQAKLAASEKHTIRFKVPRQGTTVFKDELRGEVSFENEKLDDLVLLKADGFPTYHLASVVDDHHMQITDIIRGEEWVSSTPKHILLYQAFGWEPPKFAHLNLLRNPDKSKISKRKNPTSILYYRRKGILPEVLRNFLALMGWSLGGDQEIFSTQTMIDHFTWDRFSLGGPVFDMKKLLWMNGQYLKNEPNEVWLRHLKNTVLADDYLLKIIPLVKERVLAFEEFFPASETFFSGDVSFKDQPLVPKDRSPKEVSAWLSDILEALETTDDWEVATLKNIVETYAKSKELKTSELFMVVRIAVSGSTVSPPLFETMHVLGKEMVRRRGRLAIEHLKKGQ